MKRGKNIYFYAGRKERPYVFRKIVDGKLISRAFSTLAAAEAFAEDFRSRAARGGADGLFFDAEERAAWEKVKKICGEHDPVEAVRWWKEHWREEMRESPDVREAWAEFVGWLEGAGRSRGHVKNVTATGEKFAAAFGGRKPSALSGREILDWILKLPLSPKTKKNVRGDVASFFLWCRNAKGWAAEAPLLDARLLPKVERSRVEVWNCDEAEAALRIIERRFPRLVPYFALRFFAGLRESEARKMRWEWIDFRKRTIFVPGFHDGKRVCKTGDDWLILPNYLPEGAVTVFAWLKAYGADRRGEIRAPNWYAQECLSKALRAPKNVIRHTFCTMLANWNMDDAKTIWATRHTNVQTLREHYKGVNQTREDVARYFALRPEKSLKV